VQVVYENLLPTPYRVSRQVPRVDPLLYRSFASTHHRGYLTLREILLPNFRFNQLVCV
jgi:hypothetical protein